MELEDCDIKNWRQFGRKVRSGGCHLLHRLAEFRKPILVAGVQRSGTTAVTRTISQSPDLKRFWVNRDDELDAALILSGYVQHNADGRFCFQTTYLNQCVQEYCSSPSDYRLIWVNRNPYSVVYSMLYNWRRFAVNELFDAVGIDLVAGRQKRVLELTGGRGMSQLAKACYAYTGKVRQIFYLKENLPSHKLMTVSYEDIAENRQAELSRVFDFAEVTYRDSYSEMFKASQRDRRQDLSGRQRALIDRICSPVYEQLRKI